VVIEVVVLIKALAYENPDTGNAAVFDVAKQRGAPLEPLHRDVADQELRRYFVVRLPNVREAEKLADELRAQPQVEAAYVKPAGELPNM
jgi:hypothetical protein